MFSKYYREENEIKWGTKVRFLPSAADSLTNQTSDTKIDCDESLVVGNFKNTCFCQNLTKRVCAA